MLCGQWHCHIWSVWPTRVNFAQTKSRNGQKMSDVWPLFQALNIPGGLLPTLPVASHIQRGSSPQVIYVLCEGHDPIVQNGSCCCTVWQSVGNSFWTITQTGYVAHIAIGDKLICCFSHTEHCSGFKMHVDQKKKKKKKKTNKNKQTKKNNKATYPNRPKWLTVAVIIYSDTWMVNVLYFFD